MQINFKILLIRFSSFGDVTQSLSLPAKIKDKFPQAQIHFITRKEFKGIIEPHPFIEKVWLLDRKLGIKGLFDLGLKLRQENYLKIYDVHNNFRSRLICLIIGFSKKLEILRRPTYRIKRILLFYFRINKYEMPFSGQRDLIEPLEKWGISRSLPPPPQIFPSDLDKTRAWELLQSFDKPFIALAPSAAYFLKRWPKNYWIQLIELLPEKYFVLLGGPEDRFIEDIEKAAPYRCLNLAGKCDLSVNSAIISKSELLISNDTGLMHVAEQLGHSCIALMGPAPFGFPSRATTQILEMSLACRPCSKHGQGPCTNSKYHQCLVDIKPETVASRVKKWKP